MSLPEGAKFAPGAIASVEKALEALAKDPHAARSVAVNVVLHIHQEYPKHLYKGTGTAKATAVNSAEEEAAAREDGFGEFQPEPAEQEA